MNVTNSAHKEIGNCTICFTVPEAEAFQCCEGHLFCASCYFLVKKCPVCQRPQPNSPIMCANICLSWLRAECCFSYNGCRGIFTRDLIRNHQAECYFDFTRFGELTNVCKLIGYPDCSFQFNNGNEAQAVDHFVIVHGFSIERVNDILKTYLRRR